MGLGFSQLSKSVAALVVASCRQVGGFRACLRGAAEASVCRQEN